MEIGISTASLFKRQFNEDAVATLNKLDARVCEVFLGTYSEYTNDFANLLKERKGDLKVHSIHTLNTHFEPQLFAQSERALKDAYDIFKKCLESANILGAKYYTLHGIARFKKNILYNEYEKIGKMMHKAKDFAASYGIDLCLENVEWSTYNRPGVFTALAKEIPNLRGVLDIKQARISGYAYEEYLSEMNSRIAYAHLSDCNDMGQMCLPGKGNFDFDTLVQRLQDVGFDGALLVEVYTGDYGEARELKESCDYLNELLYKHGCLSGK